ncbi:hypothetical protein DL98DRAFT_522036, partial [Cadophora sp. DSE1049]
MPTLLPATPHPNSSSKRSSLITLRACTTIRKRASLPPGQAPTHPAWHSSEQGIYPNV